MSAADDWDFFTLTRRSDGTYSERPPRMTVAALDVLHRSLLTFGDAYLEHLGPDDTRAVLDVAERVVQTRDHEASLPFLRWTVHLIATKPDGAPAIEDPAAAANNLRGMLASCWDDDLGACAEVLPDSYSITVFDVARDQDTAHTDAFPVLRVVAKLAGLPPWPMTCDVHLTTTDEQPTDTEQGARDA